jgi:transcriptional regulator with XRE-family HTH domain
MNLTQEEVAKRACVSIETVSLAERHVKWPRHPLVRAAMMAALGVTP